MLCVALADERYTFHDALLSEQPDLFIEARRAYALRRMSKAVDRQIASEGEAKARAGRWVLAWAKVAGLSI